MSQTIEQILTEGPNTAKGRWMTVIFNNDDTPFQDVIAILVLATHCSVDEAHMETWEAHQYGKAPVHFATKYECESVAKRIQAIGVQTEVRPEWDDA